MKKDIIGKTIMFIAILAYVIIFKTIFGEENILIAVMSITGLLMFMGTDLTGDITRNMLGLIFFYVLIGVGTFIAANNIWVAIPVNFIIIFMISYSFGHVIKAPMYIPFSLLYLFLLAYPVPLHEMPLRIIALIVGAISIMLPQFLINKNKIKKSSEKIFDNVSNLIVKKIECIKNKDDYKSLDDNITSMLKTLKSIIYDKKEKKFYISEEGKVNLDILVSVEKLNFLINECSYDDLKEPLNDIQDFFEEFNSKKSKENILKFIDDLKKKYSDTENITIIKVLTALVGIGIALEKYEGNKNIKNIKKDLKNDVYGLKNIKFKSIKLTYSIRISIAVVIACFIMEYFHLEQGRWIMYTVLSLTSPLLEVTKSKAKDRVIATIIGAIVIGISFSIFRNNIIRSMIVMGAGYANMYCVTYRQKMISVTISAIGAASLVGGLVIQGKGIEATSLVLSFERVLFILIGVVIALIINTFLFRYDVEKANRHLEDISNKMVIDLINNLDKITKRESVSDYLNNIYLLNSQIEQTIQNNRSTGNVLLKETEESLRNIKIQIVISIYEFKSLIESRKFSGIELQHINNVVQKIQDFNFTKTNSFSESIKDKKIDDKLIVSALFDIKNNAKLMSDKMRILE